MGNKKFNINPLGLVHLYKLSGGYFLTTIINQALPFLILPVITRFLSPAEYGNVALFSFYLALVNAVAGISIPAVISKHFFSSEKEYVAVLVGNSVVISGVISVLILLALLIVYPFACGILELPLSWLLFVPVTSFSYILFSIGLNVIRNSGKVFTFGTHQIGNTAINLCISLFMVAVLMLGWQGRLMGIVIAYIISAIIAYIYLKKNRYISFKISKNVIKIILRVILPLISNSFQIVMISQVGFFFIQHYFTKELLGLYSIGFQIAVMIQLLVDTLILSWSPYLYEQLSGKQIINKLYLTRMLYVLYAVLIAGVLFIDIADGLILKIMTTPEYYSATAFIPWLTMGLLFYGCYAMLMPVLIKYEQQKYISLATFVNMFIMLALNFWFIDIFGYMGIAYAYCITYFILFITFIVKIQKVMPLPWLKALKIWN